MEILGHAQLLNNKRVNIHSQVFPYTRPRTNSQSNPWWKNNSFLQSQMFLSKSKTCKRNTIKRKERKKEIYLGGSKNFSKSSINELLSVFFRDFLELCNDLVVLQDTLAFRFDPTTPNMFFSSYKNYNLEKQRIKDEILMI